MTRGDLQRHENEAVSDHLKCIVSGFEGIGLKLQQTQHQIQEIVNSQGLKDGKVTDLAKEMSNLKITVTDTEKHIKGLQVRWYFMFYCINNTPRPHKSEFNCGG